MAKPSRSLQQTSDLRKFISTIICWILLTCIHLPVLAEDDAVSGGSSVIIFTTTSSRLEEPVEDTSGSVSVITTPEIEVQNPTTVPEILRDLPGVSLQELGTIGESAAFSLRGAESSQTLVLLEGIRLNSPFRGGFDLGNFLIDEVGQMEVVRGSQSALYGSEAIGGVVNLKIRRAIRPLEISLTQEAGNEGTFREALSAGGRESGTDFSLTFSRTDTDGQFDHDRFRASTLGGNIGIPIRESGRLRFIYRFQEDHKELAVDHPLESPTEAFFDPNSELERRFLFNVIEYQDSIVNWFVLSWKAALVDTHLNRDNPVDSVNPTIFPYFENTD
ncbi:MAG: TonB-dependent receptor plug domain-containing protein, partial [Nitrospira sp.]|nr:TonB-dependent receptor plug domain-containing protein [Nitrospira sp.]